MPTTRTLCRILPAAALLLSCGGGDLVLPSEGEPAAIVVEQGDAQSGRVGNPLPEPIVVRVTDTQGRAVVNVPVTFAFTGGVEATVTPDSSATDADGRVVFQVVLGTQTGDGAAEIQARTAGGRRTLTAPIAFTALSAAANELTPISGDSQSAPVGTTLPEPLVVQVTDAFGNPIGGVDIAWTPPDGGSVSPATVTTGADGFAAVQVTLAPNAGIQHTTAGAPGLAGSPLTFTHTALPGAAASLEIVSGDGQSGLAGTSLPEPLVVRTRDADGNPVAGLGVTWVVTAGRGSAQPQNMTTGQDGLASTTWTLGPAPGPNTATAVVSGVGTVAFSATGEPGAPPAISIETGPPATAVRGVALSRAPAVQLREPDGSVRSQAGVTVTVALATAGATLQGTLTRTTGGNGRAEFPGLVLVGPPGTYLLAFSAPGYAGAVSDGIALGRAPTTTEITADEPDPSIAGAAVRVAFSVRSQGGTPVGTVRITSDDGASCTTDLSAGTCSLALSSVGARALTAIYSGSIEFEGSSDTESHEVRAPPPPAISIVSQPPASVTVGQAFATAPVVQLVDAGGAPLQTGGVAVSVAIESGGGTLGGATTSTTGPDGRASFPALSISGSTGRHTLRFSADGYTPAVSAPIDVQAAPPAITATAITSDDPDPSNPGQAVAVRFSVTSPAGTPAGSVVVTVSGGSETCSGELTGGDGECTLALASSGTRTITARYQGAGGFAASEGTATHSVTTPRPSALALVTQPPASATVGEAFSTAPVVQLVDGTGAPLQTSGVTVSVSIESGGGTLGGTTSRATLSDGRASFPGLSITGDPGTRTLRFSAQDYTPVVSDPVNVQAAPPAATTTSITSDQPDPSDPGQQVTVQLTVTSVSGTPDGTVQVSVDTGDDSCSATLSQGQGQCSLTLTTPGTRTITAAYGGAGGFQPSSDTESHVVSQPAPSPTASSVTVADASLPPGGTTQATVTVRDASNSPMPGVTVTLSAAGPGTVEQQSVTTGSDGVAQFTVTARAAGSIRLTAKAGEVTLAQQPTITVTR